MLVALVVISCVYLDADNLAIVCKPPKNPCVHGFRLDGRDDTTTRNV